MINLNAFKTYLQRLPMLVRSRGEAYFHSGRVISVEYDERTDCVLAYVRGSQHQPHEVSLHLGKQGEPDICHCTCDESVDCKHIVATSLWLLQNTDSKTMQLKRTNPVVPWLQTLQSPPQRSVPTTRVDDARRYTRVPAAPADEERRVVYVLAPDIPNQQMHLTVMYSKKLKSGIWGKPAKVAKRDVQSPPEWFGEHDREVCVLLSDLPQTGYQFILNDEVSPKLIPMLLESGRCYWDDNERNALRAAETLSAQAEWISLPGDRRQLQVVLSRDNCQLIFTEPLYYVHPDSGECGRVDCDLPIEMVRQLLAAPIFRATDLHAARDHLNKKLPVLGLPTPQQLPVKAIKHAIPQPRLYLRRLEAAGNPRIPSAAKGLDVARFVFVYDDKEVSALPTQVMTRRNTGHQILEIHRDTEKEREYLQLIQSRLIDATTAYGHNAIENAFEEHDFAAANQKDWLSFMAREVPEWRSLGWEIVIVDGFGYEVLTPDSWYGDVEESKKDPEYFDMEIGVYVGGERINLLPLLMQALAENPEWLNVNRSNAELGDLVLQVKGRFLTVPASRLQPILDILIEMFEKPQLQQGKLRLPQNQLLRMGDFSSWSMKTGERLRQRVDDLKQFNGLEPVKPAAGFLAQLRGYQEIGLAWLQFLRKNLLGGILADDMGLGKTVQALAHLQLEKAEGRLKHPALVIAPTSLMYNWRSESNRFAPELRVLMLHGGQRQQHFEYIKDYDLVLTTYPLVSRDQDVLALQRWSWLILDEAQNIKNSKAMTTGVIHTLKSEHRLCITGTPMENHLGELWSLYNFLMPGFLGSDSQFRRVFRIPIEKEGNRDRAMALSRRVAPLLLRRTKQQVATELPPKTEMVRMAEMGQAQRDMYESIRLSLHKRVRDEIAKRGLARSRIIVLDALLKLRQICCDPSLVELPTAKEGVESAKLELLMDLIEELLDEGRRILLFSQFTSMLDIVETRLKETNIRYVKLTGQTRDRQSPINQFQNGDVPLFLISLKAGGVGLNLTAADTVIHYDPWWNPAVEEQATDRAYRIGQDKPVFVYRLICAGSVEEKMAVLKAQKKALATSIYGDNEGGEFKLTESEIEALLAPID